MERVISTDIPAGMQGGRQVGTIPGEVIFESTAGKMAGAIRNPCFSCKFFNRPAWLKLKAAWDDPTAPIDKRKQLNGIRAALLESNNARIGEKSQTLEGELDVEHALGLLGICQPMTEIDGNPVIVYPQASCPDTVCTPQQPEGFYLAKDRDADRMGSEAYDKIMRLAVGKTP